MTEANFFLLHAGDSQLPISSPNFTYRLHIHISKVYWMLQLVVPYICPQMERGTHHLYSLIFVPSPLNPPPPLSVNGTTSDQIDRSVFHSSQQ